MFAQGFEKPDRNLLDEDLTKIPFMLRSGGYVPHIDHLVHPEISWPDFCYYRRCLWEMIEEEKKS